MNSLPIGVFDSGVGGLTVLKELVAELPNEDFIYFGDTLRAPYGSKSKETILRYAKEVSEFLTEQGVKAIVTACNTESAYALEDMKAHLSCLVLGVIEPGVEAAIARTKKRRIGVIATEATIRSRAYFNGIRSQAPQIEVFTKACPKLVPLIEANRGDEDIRRGLEEYLSYFDDKDIDTLVLGCTHYPLISKNILEYFDGGVELVNPAFNTAKALRAGLEKEGMINLSAINGKHSYYASKSTEFMKKLVFDISGNKEIKIFDKFN